MNQKLRDAAVRGIMDPHFTKTRGLCQSFARQCVQSAFGHKFDAYHGPNATVSAYRWRRGGFAVSRPIEIGDLLYKTDGRFGHVGIFVGTVHGYGTTLVAENSSISTGRVSGAKGYRTLRQYEATGDIDIIVRIPGLAAPAEPCFVLVLHGKAIAQMPVRDDRSYVQVTQFAEHLGLEVGWLAAEKHIVIGGGEFPGPVWIRDGHAFAPIRELSRFVGLAIREPDENRQVILHRP